MMKLERIEKATELPSEDEIRKALVVLSERYPDARVTARIEGRAVRLQGSVRNPEHRREIVRFFGEVTGTRNLINAIRIG